MGIIRFYLAELFVNRKTVTYATSDLAGGKKRDAMPSERMTKL